MSFLRLTGAEFVPKALTESALVLRRTEEPTMTEFSFEPCVFIAKTPENEVLIGELEKVFEILFVNGTFTPKTPDEKHKKYNEFFNYENHEDIHYHGYIVAIKSLVPQYNKFCQTLNVDINDIVVGETMLSFPRANYHRFPSGTWTINFCDYNVLQQLQQQQEQERLQIAYDKKHEVDMFELVGFQNENPSKKPFCPSDEVWGFCNDFTQSHCYCYNHKNLRPCPRGDFCEHKEVAHHAARFFHGFSGVPTTEIENCCTCEEDNCFCSSDPFEFVVLKPEMCLMIENGDSSSYNPDVDSMEEKQMEETCEEEKWTEDELTQLAEYMNDKLEFEIFLTLENEDIHRDGCFPCASPPPKTEVKEKKLCLHWMNGFCRNGSKCNDGRPPKSPITEGIRGGGGGGGGGDGEDKRNVCTFWKQNRCNKGDKCYYLHQTPSPSPSSKAPSPSSKAPSLSSKAPISASYCGKKEKCQEFLDTGKLCSKKHF